MYWLAVGADAVGGRIGALQATLYKQLTGKPVKGDDNDDHERQSMLVGAMAEKRRALVVLDDPWTPEQARYLNPIDGSRMEHRLLVTTRMRDLVSDFQAPGDFSLNGFAFEGVEGDASGAPADG